MASQPRSSRHLHLCVKLWAAAASVDLRKKRATTRPTWNTNNNTRLSKTADTDKLTAKRSPTLRAGSSGFQTNTLAPATAAQRCGRACVSEPTRRERNPFERKWKRKKVGGASGERPISARRRRLQKRIKNVGPVKRARTPANAFATVKANLLG